MSDILAVFAWLEGLLLGGSLLAFIWGIVRGWEIEILMPISAAIFGTLGLAVAFLITVVIHDHVHFGVS